MASMRRARRGNRAEQPAAPTAPDAPVEDPERAGGDGGQPPADPPPRPETSHGPSSPDFSTWTPEQIKAWGEAQRLTATDVNERQLVFRQLHIALALLLGGAVIATAGVLLTSTGTPDAAAKLTAIMSISTAVIGAGAALLPTGAAAGAAGRIVSRPLVEARSSPAPTEPPSATSRADAGR